MKYLAALLATAAPALAHTGAHLHPHGEASSAWPLIAAAALVGLAGVLMVRRARR